jgi:predicted RNA binding protein YcfA (HicA-like mRNA interferase family)
MAVSKNKGEPPTIYKHLSKAVAVTIAGKPSVEVPKDTLNAILEQSGLKK